MLECVHGDECEIGEAIQFVLRKVAGRRIDRADGAETMTLACGERNAGIGTHMRVAGHERVLHEPLVRRGIRHHHWPARGKRMHAEGLASRHFRGAKALRSLVPLAMSVDRRDRGHGHVQHATGQANDAVKYLFARRIEKIIALQCGEALDLPLLRMKHGRSPCGTATDPGPNALAIGLHAGIGLNPWLQDDGQSKHRFAQAICSNVHCRGALSGRQRRNLVPCRKRPPVTWSKRTSTTSSGAAAPIAPLRSVLQRLGPPGALPVKPGGSRSASSSLVSAARSSLAIVEVKPTWSSLPSSS